MKYPKGDDGLYGRFAKWLFEFYKKWWVQYGLSPALLAVPPVFITTFYGNQTFKAAIVGLLPTTAGFLIEYVVFAIAFAALYPAVLLAFAKSIVKKVDGRGVNVEGLLALLASIDQIVGCKADRFAGYAANVQSLTKETAFCQLTQPRTQIAEITRGVSDLFNALRTDKKATLIRVVLATLENGQITAIPIHYPQDEPVNASVEVLNDPSSTIMTVARTKKIVVISSIEKELEKPKAKRRFVDTGNEEDNTGSLICYPVSQKGKNAVPFVISIHCDQAGYFKEEFSELYKHSLQRFALRLSLEYSLLTIKEKICEPNS